MYNSQLSTNSKGKQSATKTIRLQSSVNVPGRFTTLAVSTWQSELFGHFQTSLGFETAWLFQNLRSQSTVDGLTMVIL